MSSNGVLTMPPDQPSLEELSVTVKRLVGLQLGLSEWGAKSNHVSFNSNSEYSATIQNQGSGGHLNIPSILQVTNSGVTISSLVVSGALSVLGNFSVGSGPAKFTVVASNGNTAILGTLNVTGLTTLGSLSAGASALGATTITGNLSQSGGTWALVSPTTGILTTVGNRVDTVGGVYSATITGAASLSAASFGLTGATTITGATIVNGTATFRNSAGSTTHALIDPGNSRIVLNSGTALGSDTTPATHVVGRLYVAPDSANDLALELRRSSASATPAIRLGLSSSGELVIKDETDTVIALLAGATYALAVTGDAQVSDDLAVGTRAVIGGSTWAGGEELRVVGNSRFEGTIGVTTGGIDVTGNSTFRSPVTLDGASLLVAGASVTITGGGIGVSGNSSFDAAVSITNGPLTLPATDPPTANGVATAGSLVKAFGYVTGGGGASLGQNYNVSSVARNGTGDFTVSIDRDFSAATYAVVATIQDNGADLIWRINGQASGSFDIHFRTTAGVLTDPDAFSFACFGTLT